MIKVDKKNIISIIEYSRPSLNMLAVSLKEYKAIQIIDVKSFKNVNHPIGVYYYIGNGNTQVSDYCSKSIEIDVEILRDKMGVILVDNDLVILTVDISTAYDVVEQIENVCRPKITDIGLKNEK